jgi:polyhydroxybutyrate depolymerase
MKTFPLTLLLAFVFVLVAPLQAQRRRPLDESLQQIEIEVGDLRREFLLFVPKDNRKPAPVVFGFHGHGGTASNSARKFDFQKHWPEAIVVYMQGIPTPGALTDPQGKRNGWQSSPGDHADRDLIFFDRVLVYLKNRHQIDESRIYSTGHSNGGSFTYLLWAKRADVFAAVTPSASAAGKVRKLLTPKPVMHLAGEKDILVKFWWQELTMKGIQKLNQCEADGKKWAKYATLYSSKLKTPVVTYIHPGTHKYPTEAPPLIVKFFKKHRKSSASTADGSKQLVEEKN